MRKASKLITFALGGLVTLGSIFGCKPQDFSKVEKTQNSVKAEKIVKPEFADYEFMGYYMNGPVDTLDMIPVIKAPKGVSFGFDSVGNPIEYRLVERENERYYLHAGYDGGLPHSRVLSNTNPHIRIR